MILALDGHDGAGKTTLAKALAARLKAQYIRPFSGELGSRLMVAYESGDEDETLRIGETALANCVNNVPVDGLAVLDRGWLTIATLISADKLIHQWRLWLPTALIWCDLPTTLTRLKQRKDEPAEPEDWHALFLDTYLERAALRQVPVIRTDQNDENECLRQLERLLDGQKCIGAYETQL